MLDQIAHVLAVRHGLDVAGAPARDLILDPAQTFEGNTLKKPFSNV